jgi:hypothetical protein
MKKLSSTGGLLLLVALMAAPAALAQVPRPEMTSSWTIDQPTLVGNTVLQPGTYRIRVVSRPSDRNMVRVMSTDEQTLYTTVLTVPHPLKPGEDLPASMFVFWPAVGDQPRALRTWFPAEAPSGGGHTIVYDENRATLIARASNEPVTVYTGTIEEPVVTVLAPREVRTETPVVVERRTETTVTTTERPTMVAQVREQLPATAGTTPLVALLGLLSIAGALIIRASIR